MSSENPSKALKGEERPTGEKHSAERTESTETRSGEASEAGEAYGRNTEELRKLSFIFPTPSDMSCSPNPSASAPRLVRRTCQKLREVTPATTARPGGDGLGAVGLVSIESVEGYWSATGTRAALLAAGLCTPAHFPQARKRVANGKLADGSWWTLRLMSKGQCRLCVSRSAKDRELFNSQARARAEQALKVNLRALAQLTGPEPWRVRSLESLATYGGFLRLQVTGQWSGGVGFRLSDRALRDFDAMVRRLELLISSAEVVPDHPDTAEPAGTAQDEQLPRLRAPLHLVSNRP